MTFRTALLLDFWACLLGAILILVFPDVWDLTGLPDDWRGTVGIALCLFAGLLVATWYQPITILVWTCVIGNILWVIAGAWALTRTSSNLGMAIILLVMVADGIMAALQSQPLLKGKAR